MSVEFQNRRGLIVPCLFVFFSAFASGQNELEQEFESAKSAWLAANDTRAETLFSQLVNKSKSDIEILAQCYYYLGDLHLARKNFTEAIVNNKKILKLKLPHTILKNGKFNGDHLKYLACSTLADIYLATKKYNEALRFLEMEKTDYNTAKSIMLSGPFVPPDCDKELKALRWAEAYEGIELYDSAIHILLPYAFGENKINNQIFEKVREITPKGYTSLQAHQTVEELTRNKIKIDLLKKQIRIYLFQKSLCIPIDESLSMYLINDQTVENFVLNSRPIKFLLTASW